MMRCALAGIDLVGIDAWTSRHRRHTGTLLILFLLPGFLGAAPKDKGARVLSGTDRVVARAPAGAVIESYRNQGYRLRVAEDGRVEVEVDLSPLESHARFELPRRTDQPAGIEALSRSLVSGSRTQYTAASRILGWVGRNIRYQLDREASQDARSVLVRRTGYCTGISRLTVAMLSSVGIEAREVSGYVVGETPGAPMGYHRWIEIHLDDKGWVFSDPTSSHHFVPATYVRLASETLDLTRSHRSTLLHREQQTFPIDIYPLASDPILARRNSVRQRAASISFEVDGARTGRAWLSGNDELHTLDMTRGRGAFVGLPTGRYDLIVVTDRGQRFRRIVEFKNPVNMRLELRPRAGAGGSTSTGEPAVRAAGGSLD